jgi:N-formylmaleamate deformylase
MTPAFKEHSMTKWSDGYVQANGIRIHYYRTGGDKPQVVMNHGAGDDGLCWTRVAEELQQDYDLILPDARGHGKSAPGKGDYATAPRVEDLAGLIQALKLDRPVVGGHSLGADTSMNLAATYPAMARGVFLEDPPILLPGEVFLPPDMNIKEEDLGKMMMRYWRTFKYVPGFIGVRLARKASPGYPDNEIKPWIASKRRVSSDFMHSMASLKFDGESQLEVIARINVPVLLIIGDKTKISIVSPEGARRAGEANPCVQVVQLQGASHDIRRTRFDGYLPALKQFVAQVEAA